MVGRGATVGVTAVFVIALLCIYGNYLDSSTTSSAAWIKPTDQQAARKMTPLEAENDGNTLLFQQRLVHYESIKENAVAVATKGTANGRRKTVGARGGKNKVAVAITVLTPLKDKQGGPIAHFLDGAAVLASSVREVNKRSKYPADLIAIVHPSVDKLQRDILADAGYEVREKKVGVTIEQIRGKALKEQIGKSGCCGIAELLKIEAWTFTEYHHVLHLDADCLMLHPVDELIEMQKPFIYAIDLSLTPNSFLPKKNAKLQPAERYQDWYKRSVLGKKAMMQGGLLLLKPDMKMYGEIISTIKEGNFVDGLGWGGTGIGWGYGGQTVQGVLPYFFMYKKKPEFSHVVDICVYDNMVDNDWCKAIPQHQIKIVHFTACQKPWYCIQQDEPNCKFLRLEWWKISRFTEKYLKSPKRKQCWVEPHDLQSYESMTYPSVKKARGG